jgi:hypothetical protein
MLLALTGCQQHYDMVDTNAVYYWRTELRLDSTERTFLNNHNINKVYCRYFDVVMAPIPQHEGQPAPDEAVMTPMPNATISFIDTLPEGVEIVPTVYITEDCMHERHEGLAGKLVRRILQMNETNDIHGVSEIQIDCDYTARSRQVYYDFLEEVRSQLSIIHYQLSITIRLHQLSMPPPPVDYGVLMLYNTGDPQRFTERNPVLDMRDVAPYLRYLDSYPLPLAPAYPVYLWVRNISGVRVEHSVEADEILRVKQAVEHERPELRHTVVTYHLDKENINRYTHETYEAIYRH